MLGVKKTTGLTGDDLSALGSDLLDLSGQLGVARGELAQIAETAGQLGIEGRDNITAFTETVAKLSSVSELSAQEAGDQIAKLANVFDVPIEEAERRHRRVEVVQRDRGGSVLLALLGQERVEPTPRVVGDARHRSRGVQNEGDVRVHGCE